MTTLAAAFKPYLAEAADCACEVCLAVGAQVYITGTGKRLIRDESAYWAAVAEQLRVLAAGVHERVRWDDHVRALPGYDPNQPAMPAPQTSITSGLWLGFGSGLHDRPHPPWVPARVCPERKAEVVDLPVSVPVQLDLFEVAS